MVSEQVRERKTVSHTLTQKAFQNTITEHQENHLDVNADRTTIEQSSKNEKIDTTHCEAMDPAVFLLTSQCIPKFWSPLNFQMWSI